MIILSVDTSTGERVKDVETLVVRFQHTGRTRLEMNFFFLNFVNVSINFFQFFSLSLNHEARDKLRLII